MANELSFITRVDLSGLNSGMQGAASVVQSGSEKMAQAMSRVNVEQKALNEALKQLGPLAAQGNEQAVAAVSEHISSLAAAKSALNEVKASTDALNASEAQETATLQTNVSQRMAASAEMRVLEGNILGSTRAAGAFLVTLPGVGAALQAAFPIFGAVALIEVLGDMVQGINHVIDAYHELGSAARQAGVEQALAAANGIVTLQPKVGLVEGIARTIKGMNLEKQLSTTGTALTTSTVAGTEREFASQEALLRSQNQLNEAGLKGSALAHQRQQDIQKEIDLHNRQIETISLLESSLIGISKNPESTKSQTEFASKEVTSAVEKIQKLNTQIAVLQNEKAAQGKRGDAEDESRAPRLQMEKIEQSFRELGNVAPGQAATFWYKYIDAFAAYGDIAISESNTVLEKYNRAIEAAGNQDTKGGQLGKKWAAEQERMALVGANGEAARAGLDAVNKALKEQGEDALQTGTRWDSYNAEVAKGVEIHSQSAAAIQQASISVELAEGRITKLSAAEQLAAAHAQAYKERIAELREELEKLQKEGAGLHPGDQGYEENASRQQNVKNQITQIQGQAQTSSITDTASVASKMSQPYVNAMDTINTAWLQTENKLIFGTRSVSQAFANMGVSILQSTAASFEKMLISQLRYEIQSEAAHRAAKATQGQIDIQSAATGEALAKQTALHQALIDAKGAAAGAFKWVMKEVPAPINFALAPAAAAAAYAGTMALAAFETGGIIPNTGVALVHQGEAVIPAPLTNLLMNAASTNNSSSSASMTQNFHGGMTDAQFRRMATRSAGHMVSVVRRGLRDQGKT